MNKRVTTDKIMRKVKLPSAHNLVKLSISNKIKFTDTKVFLPRSSIFLEKKKATIDVSFKLLFRIVL